MVTKTKLKPKPRKTLHRKKDFLHELQDDSQLQNLAIGASAICLLGAAAAVTFFVTKNRKTSRLETAYNNLTETVGDYAHDAYEKGEDAYGSAKDILENITDVASDLFATEDKSRRNIVLGVIGTTLLGASAAYYLSQSEPEGLNGTLKKNFDKFSDIGKVFINTVSSKLSDDAHKKTTSDPIHSIMDWASTGFNIWQEIKKRR